MNAFRLAVGAIVLHEEKILLVRYAPNQKDSYLVGPGGGVEYEEDMSAALVREVKEETNLTVEPVKIIFVEDLLCKRYRMVKVWFLCKFIGGEIIDTQAAKVEGIVEVKWFSREQLDDETVYPALLKNIDWQKLNQKTFETSYLGLHKADF